jgi:hypothetical protein
LNDGVGNELEEDRYVRLIALDSQGALRSCAEHLVRPNPVYSEHIEGMTRPSPLHRTPRALVGWTVFSALGVAALAVGCFGGCSERPAPLPTAVRFTVSTPENGALRLTGRPVISPDGQSVLFAVIDTATQRSVWYQHSFATKLSRILKGTETFLSAGWSYDSRSILLRRSGEVWTMDVNSGSRQELPIVVGYSSWQREGIVGGGQRGLRWFRPDGSDARWIKKRDDEKGIVYSYPSLIPGGRWLLYNAETEQETTSAVSLHLATLDTKVDREILKTERPTVYAGPGYLLSLRGDVLTAQQIDPESGALRGGPTPIVGSVAAGDRAVDRLGSFSASDNGVLVFRTGGALPDEGVGDSFTVIMNWPSLLNRH